ncbi:hypothetical protein [Sodalis sp. C49]|uniref:hypothetical protein n=1 Tax=Sodalis sp. C49 TaxID=3228929 RepID=UPI003965C998
MLIVTPSHGVIYGVICVVIVYTTPFGVIFLLSARIIIKQVDQQPGVFISLRRIAVRLLRRVRRRMHRLQRPR